MSLARAHFERVMAAREAKTAAASPGAAVVHGTLAGRMRALLAMHQVKLKQIKSRQAKIEAKRELLPEYAAYIDGILAADVGGKDDLVTRIMLWRLDVANWYGALRIAGYALRHGLTMPDGFARDVPTTVVEEIADYALALTTPDDALAAPLDAALELTDGADMPDEVRAKAHKALGLLWARTSGASDRAVTHLETALMLDPKIGVKTELGRAKKALDAQMEET